MVIGRHLILLLEGTVLFANCIKQNKGTLSFQMSFPNAGYNENNPV